MRGEDIPWKSLAACTVALLLPVITVATGGEQEPGRRTFDLSEISVFEIDEQVRGQFLRGQLATCSEQRPSEIRAYPAFKSDKPIYGSIEFAREYGEEHSAKEYYFAIDEDSGTRQGYDRLYFDLDHDLDLTNDTPVEPLKSPPDGALLNYPSVKQQVCFDYLYVDFEYGSDGERPLEIMPRLIIHDSGYASVGFVTTRAFKGDIEIGGRKYGVVLGHNFQIAGWFDKPSTALCLIPEGDWGHRPFGLAAECLMSMHSINGTLYQFSAAPSGEQLTVQPYKGAYGKFKIGSGWRFTNKTDVQGSLFSKDCALSVGKNPGATDSQPARSCRIPVGDYLPLHLSITLGRLKIDVSDNYHSDGKPRDMNRPKVFGIKVRENRTTTLDFSNEPDVIFASPGRNSRIKLSEQLNVKAVLVDPKLDIMIRNLQSKPYQGLSFSYTIIAAILLSAPGILWLCLPSIRKRYRILPVASIAGLIILVWCHIILFVVNSRSAYDKISPEVVITRANGERVATGIMPFG